MSLEGLRKLPKARPATAETRATRSRQGGYDPEQLAPEAPVAPFVVDSVGATEQRMSFRVGGSWCRVSSIDLQFELIALMTDELVEAARAREPHVSPHDIDRLERVRKCLTEHLATPPTLTQLARMAGFNETLLKGRFRALFGTSVFAYLRQMRIPPRKVDHPAGAHQQRSGGDARRARAKQPGEDGGALAFPHPRRPNRRRRSARTSDDSKRAPFGRYLKERTRP